MVSSVTLEDVKAAAERIRPFIHKTPVLTCSTLDKLAPSCALFFKCENLQKVGAFKIRGATNAVLSLPAGKRSVVTHSSGNHAQALALAARTQGIKCHVVMPRDAPSVKKAAVRGYGAVVTECESSPSAREDVVKKLLEANPELEFISPHNDLRVIAGQGTAALELIAQVAEMGKELDVVITPVGGGGLLSGCATTAKGLKPEIWVVGAEPLGADDAYRSFKSKQWVPSVNPRTIADGLLTSLGDNTFPLILRHVDAIHTVTEAQIISALRLVYERMKLVIEPSAAVPLAVALYSHEFKASLEGLRMKLGRPNLHVGIVFSGGNADIIQLGKLFEQSECAYSVT